MTFRPISGQQASAVLNILVECGHRVVDPRDVDAFMRKIIFREDAGPLWPPLMEYRFCGALGSGGTFRNNGKHDNTPHVDCRPEDETPERLAMIERANKMLAELFGGRPSGIAADGTP